jgi:ribosomal protein S18 acetylase RimI-like enzyme
VSVDEPSESRYRGRVQPPIGLRLASRADLPTLGRLGALLVSTHHRFDPKRFMSPGPGSERGYARFLGTQLDDPEAVVLVAESDGEVVGYAYATIEGPDYNALRGPAGVLHDLVVDPDHRGAGIGRRLLDEALLALAARGAPRVVLSAAEGNAAAQRLFTGAGFRRTMVEMTRELNDDP